MAKACMPLPKKQGVSRVTTKADDKSPLVKTKNGPNGQRTSKTMTPKASVATEILLPAPRTVKPHPLPKRFDGNVSPKSNTPATRMKGSY